MDNAENHPFRNVGFFVLELACIPFIIYWSSYNHLPAPGWAVAFIAGAAAAMSIHDNMKGWQKALWMVIIGAFLITELRAISKDRREAQNQATQDRKNQDEDFGRVLATQNRQFAATVQGFFNTNVKVAGVLSKTQSVALLAKENLENVTGGDAFADVLPQIASAQEIAAGGEPPQKPGEKYAFNMVCRNEGNRNLTGVVVTISLVIREFADHTLSDNGIMKPINLGTIAANGQLDLPYFMLPKLGIDGTAHYVIEITAQNGATVEDIYFRSSKDDLSWAYKLDVKRNIHNKIRTVKNIDWTEPKPH